MTSTSAGGGRSAPSSPWTGWLLAAAVAVTLLPAVVAVARAATSDWEPSGDQAMEVLRMHDTGTAHTPLLGPYSRFGWDHPGPLLFWVGAPALRLAGPVGVMVLVGLLNAAAVVGTVIAARRLAGTAFALLVAATTAVLVHSHGAVKLVDPWNPWVTVLPLLCYLFTVPVAASTGSRRAAAVAVLTGSFAAQSHLGNLPVVVATAAGGVVWWWFATRRARPAGAWPAGLPDGTSADHSGVAPTGRTASIRRGRRLLGLLGALVVALWSGPLIDQVVNDPGNLTSLVEFVLDSPEEAAPLGESLGAAARELGFLPAWAGAREEVWPVDPAPVWTLLVLPVALAVGASPAARRRTGGPATRVPLAALAALVHVAATFTVTRTTGGLIAYVLRWTWPVAVFATAVALLPLVDLLRRHRTPVVRIGRAVAAGLAGAVVVVAATAAALDAARQPVEPSPATDRSARELARALRPVLPAGAYGLEWLDVRSFSAVSIGTAANLTRHGYDIDFPADHAGRVGEFRARGRTDRPLVVIVGQTPSRLWPPPPDARRLLHWDHLTEAERARADAIEVRVRHDADLDPDKLLTVDTVDARADLLEAGARPEDVAVLHRLEADREWYDVWLLPAGSPRDL